MKLSRIYIEQFRRFRQPLEIRDLDPGLNLFIGPNEAGKSTIVAAIRAAFFERHRSTSVDDLRPWDAASASPTVELEFEVDAQPYRLVKSFLGRKRCELQIGSRHLDSAAAEDHLAELLGFRHAGRGASGAEHWGIPGLLWIQQGAAQELAAPVGHATDHLRHALQDALGEVTGSSGDGVLRTVEQLRNELLTPSAGKPKGPYAGALERENGLSAEVSRLDSEIAIHRHKVDTLAVLRKEQAADESERPWMAFRELERDAATRLESLGRIEEQLAAERQQAGRIENKLSLLVAQLENFAQQEKEAETRQAEQDAARQRHTAAALRTEEWRQRNVEAAQTHAEALARLRRSRQAETLQRLNREREDALTKKAQAAQILDKAENELLRVQKLRTEAAAASLNPDDLDILRRQHRQLRELDIQINAAATRLRFALEPGCHLHIGPEMVASTGERHLLEATTLILPGLGTLEIAPGGSDLTELRQQQAAAADRHKDLLLRLGLASLETAETRYRFFTQTQAELKTAEATLHALAPQGVNSLQGERSALEARVVEIEQTLHQIPKADEDSPPIGAAEAAEEAARASLTAVGESLQAALLEAGKAHVAVVAAEREWETAKALLAAPDRAERLKAANRDLVETKAEQATVAARIETLAAKLAAARPDILRQDVERYRKSAEQHEKSYHDRRDTLLRLEVELQAPGALNLDECRAERERDLAQARRRAEELRRQALALDLLLKLLREKRRNLTLRLQAPLQAHLNRYLPLLFPEARLEIDENLTPGPLIRTDSLGPVASDFEGLSFGAREQMGVISRLAYAELLREAGRPTLLILDDALVHSDEERLECMKRILFDAATRHQILLFTCHPGKWRGLGVRARNLGEMREGG